MIRRTFTEFGRQLWITCTGSPRSSDRRVRASTARIRNGVERAAKTLHTLDWFQVSEVRGTIDEGSVGWYQVTLKVGLPRRRRLIVLAPGGASTLAGRITGRVPRVVSRMQEFGTTIFAEMSALAVAHRRRSTSGRASPTPTARPRCSRPRVAAIRGGRQPVPAGPGHAGAARRRSPTHQQRFYGLELDPDTEVLVTAGATEAIAGAAARRCCDAGDEVVAFEPFYDSLRRRASPSPARVAAPVPLRRADGLTASTPTSCAAAVTPRTRLILLNTPHNPTGKVFDARRAGSSIADARASSTT